MTLYKPKDAGLNAANISSTVHAFQYRLEMANTGGWYLEDKITFHYFICNYEMQTNYW